MTVSTNVPAIVWSDAGLTIPAESDVLSGVQTDINSAFGGGLNPALETPQGQLASSLAAIIGDKNNEFLSYVNHVDPQYADGRMQDAIGRIYFLARKGATSTSVSCTLTGAVGAIIYGGSLAQDTSNQTYALTGAVTIGADGTGTGEFQNIATGPIPCAIGTLTQIYQAVPGWDTVMNDTAGTLGQNEESRADFEYRRENSVSLNGKSTAAAIYAEVFDQSNVTDVYVIDNPRSVAVFTGSIATTTLTVSQMTSGILAVGSVIIGTGVASNTRITAFGTGQGGIGNYTVNNSQSISSESMASYGVAFGSTNYQLSANSVYVAAVGGLDADIASAIWRKKDLGCAMNGNATVSVIDDSGYSYPYPTYSITFERPTSLAMKFAVQIVNSTQLPANTTELVRAAIIARFNGTDGTTRERIGAMILASRYYTAIQAAVPNAGVVSILIGSSTATLTQYQVGIDQAPTIDASNITVTLV